MKIFHKTFQSFAFIHIVFHIYNCFNVSYLKNPNISHIVNHVYIKKNQNLSKKHLPRTQQQSPAQNRQTARTVHQSPHTREATTVHHSPKDSWVFCPQSINLTICLRSTGRRSCGFGILHKISKNGQKKRFIFHPAQKRLQACKPWINRLP